MSPVEQHAVQIRSFGAREAEGDHATTCADIEACILSVLDQERPASVVFVTSSELFPFTSAEVRSLLQMTRTRAPYATCKVLSQACLGFHAFLLDFVRSLETSALAIFLEVPSDINQICLDSIGAGTNGDGLKVKPGYGYLYCERTGFQELSPKALVLRGVHVFSQTRTVSGTLDLARRILWRVGQGEASEAARVISFDTGSVWSKKLRDSFSYWEHREPHQIEWLPSVEYGDEHFSTLKPLLELDHYREELGGGAIAILTLGAGGRVGFSVVSGPTSTLQDAMVATEEVHRTICMFEESLAEIQPAQEEFTRTRNLDSFHQFIKDHLLYMDPEATREDNAFYVWNLGTGIGIASDSSAPGSSWQI